MGKVGRIDVAGGEGSEQVVRQAREAHEDVTRGVDDSPARVAFPPLEWGPRYAAGPPFSPRSMEYEQAFFLNGKRADQTSWHRGGGMNRKDIEECRDDIATATPSKGDHNAGRDRQGPSTGRPRKERTVSCRQLTLGVVVVGLVNTAFMLGFLMGQSPHGHELILPYQEANSAKSPVSQMELETSKPTNSSTSDALQTKTGQILPTKNISEDQIMGQIAIASANESQMEPIILTASKASEVYDMTFWGKNNRLCKAISSDMIHPGAAKRPILVNMAFSCNKLFKAHRLGTGNWLWLFYAMRLAAEAHGNVDLNAKCNDDDLSDVQKSLVLPWILDHHRPQLQEAIAPSDSILKQACSGHKKAPMWHMIPALRRDLRSMARHLVGVPEWHREMDNGADSAPVHEGVELDETAWHFRCGDVMSAYHPGYAWHKFGRLASHIHNNTASIGIVTQPFDKQGSRKQDYKKSKGRDNSEACERLAGELVDYLQRRFPSARVSLRNDADESIALAYSRMIVAKQAIVGGVSTFGVFAALASWGQAILVAPDFPKAPGTWLLKWEKIREDDSNVIFVHDPKPLILPQAQYLWWKKKNGGKEGFIRWLTDDDLDAETSMIEGARRLRPPPQNKTKEIDATA